MYTPLNFMNGFAGGGQGPAAFGLRNAPPPQPNVAFDMPLEDFHAWQNRTPAFVGPMPGNARTAPNGMPMMPQPGTSVPPTNPQAQAPKGPLAALQKPPMATPQQQQSPLDRYMELLSRDGLTNAEAAQLQQLGPVVSAMRQQGQAGNPQAFLASMLGGAGSGPGGIPSYWEYNARFPGSTPQQYQQIVGSYMSGPESPTQAAARMGQLGVQQGQLSLDQARTFGANGIPGSLQILADQNDINRQRFAAETSRSEDEMIKAMITQGATREEVEDARNMFRNGRVAQPAAPSATPQPGPLAAAQPAPLPTDQTPVSMAMSPGSTPEIRRAWQALLNNADYREPPPAGTRDRPAMRELRRFGDNVAQRNQAIDQMFTNLGSHLQSNPAAVMQFMREKFGDQAMNEWFGQTTPLWGRQNPHIANVMAAANRVQPGLVGTRSIGYGAAAGQSIGGVGGTIGGTLLGGPLASAPAGAAGAGIGRLAGGWIDRLFR